ncbi:MAG TPA: glycosyltransferase family 39 protein [Beijerinckiaceae bacterium]|nr:glycosyltransferase family 39 protein [Beijerinckiaceae bacterium]
MLRRTTEPGPPRRGPLPAGPLPAVSSAAGWPLWPTLGLFGLAWLALSWPWLSGRVTVPWDAKAHFYPQLQFLAQSIHRGEAPWWAPYVFSGHPQIADPQSLIFSPPHLLLALLDADPSFRAADAVELGMLGLGGVALILLFRDRAWHPIGAVAAALAFAFGASAGWRIQHVGQVMSLSYWPIALWLLLRALERGSLAFGLMAGVAAGLMALGRDQVAYLGLWLLVGAVLWSWAAAPLRRAAIRRSLPPLLLAALAGALVVVVPVVLTMLLSASSNRAAIDLAGAGQGSLHPALLFTGVIPNLFGADGPFLDYWGPPSPRWGPVDLFFARNMGVVYIGALPIAAIAVGGMRGVLWAREVRFFTVAAAALLVYALGRYTPAFGVLFWHLPGVDLFRRPADATFLYGALAAILAGYAIHRWWSGTLPAATPWHRAAEILVVASLFGGATVLALHKGAPTATFAAIAGSLAWLGAGLLLVAADPARLRRSHAWATAATAAVPAFLVADLAWNNGPNESTALPPAMYEVLRPESRDPLLGAAKARLGDASLDRIELTGLGFHWPNASLVHRLHNVLGYNPVRLALYAAATGAEDTVALPEQRKFSPLFPSYRSTLVDLLGLRFIATGAPIETIDPKLRPGDLNLLGSYGGRYLYENPRAMPRVLFADRAASADFAAMLKNGEWPDVDLRTTVLLDRQAASVGAEPARDGDGSGAARILSYRNNEVVIEVESERGGYVILNDPHHPWWFASVDGTDVPVLRANVLFRAVAVPAGRHRVRFDFRPLVGAWGELTLRRGG